jgi:cytosine/adenosine deaminase-related metal-dependent hydrolase
MLVLTARYVLPVTDEPIDDGCVALDGERIVYVGPTAGAPEGPRRDLGDVILMPGLVNAHCHLELTVMRGFLEDLEFRRWILRLTSARRSVLTRDTMLDSARLGLVEGIAAGITTYADTCESGVVFDAMLERGVRGIMYQEVFGPDPAVADAQMADLRAKVDALRARETALVRVGISPHAPYTVSDALFRAAAEYARSASLPMAIHIAESEAESRLIVEGAGSFADGLRGRGVSVAPRGRSPIGLLAGLGVLEASPLLIHCIRADPADIAAVAAARGTVAHCPTSNAKLGHGIAPLLEWLDAGVDVGLGSDSVASNNRMDLLDEARAAVLFQRARAFSHDTPTSHDALALATIGGAAALGLADRVGSLEVGKEADLAAFPLTGSAPVHDPEAAAIFGLAAHQASFVMVAGRVIRDTTEPSPADRELATRVQQSADALQQWLADGGELTPPPPLH